MIRILFLCTGNSARSIMAEAALNGRGAGRFEGVSAGSQPTGKVNPFALGLIAEEGYPNPGYRSKSWDEFGDGEPVHGIITVCASAAGETCPIWPGRPSTAHWGVDDPAAVTGSDAEKRAAFRLAHDKLAEGIDQLVAAPDADLTPEALPNTLKRIAGLFA